MTFAERLNMMQKRHAYFEAMAENCSSFEEFIISYNERLTILGIELSHQGNYLYLYMPLGFSDYEGYHIVHIQDSKLIVSQVIS